MKTGCHIAVLVVCILFIIDVPAFWSSDFADTDAAVHAMDGIFFRDFFHGAGHFGPGDEAALGGPTAWKNYAINYYAHYPSLGLVIYPPLFPVLLVPFYELLGISAPVARLAVGIFAIANIVAFYFLMKHLADENAALAASLIFLFNIEIVRWSREAMLEIPALFFMNAAALSWVRFIDDGKGEKKRLAFASLIFLAAAVYTKQTSGFLIVVFFVYGILRRGLRAFAADRTVLISLATFAVMLTPLAMLTLKYGSYGTVQLDPGTYGQSFMSLRYWLQWAELLPSVIDPAVLLLILVSVPFLVKKPDDPVHDVRNLVAFFSLWFLCWYATFSWIPIKTLRFATFAVPPVAGLAGIFFSKFSNRIRGRRLADLKTVAAIVLCIAAIRSTAAPVPYMNGFEQAARYCVSTSSGKPVLFDGYHSANFIFHMRRFSSDAPESGTLILRGSKMITSTASGALKNYPMIETETGLTAMLKTYAVDRIVIEDQVDTPLSLPHTAWLRKYLATGPFTLEKSFPIESNIPWFEGKKILVYHYTNATELPADRMLEIFVPSAGMTIRVKI